MSAGVRAPDAPQPEPPRPAPETTQGLLDAWASLPLGQGSRVLLLEADQPPEGICVAYLRLEELQGITEAKFYSTSRKAFRRVLAGLRDEPQLGWAQLPPGYAAQLVGEALARNRHSGTPIPRPFSKQGFLIDGIASSRGPGTGFPLAVGSSGRNLRPRGAPLSARSDYPLAQSGG